MQFQLRDGPWILLLNRQEDLPAVPPAGRVPEGDPISTFNFSTD